MCSNVNRRDFMRAMGALGVMGTFPLSGFSAQANTGEVPLSVESLQVGS